MFIVLASLDCRTPLGVPCSVRSRAFWLWTEADFDSFFDVVAEHRTPKGVPGAFIFPSYKHCTPLEWVLPRTFVPKSYSVPITITLQSSTC
jgi:hypothetical protein